MENHSVKQRRSFDLVANFPPGLKKLAAPFIWTEAKWGAPSGNRCSGCLMLACGGPAGWETRGDRDPVPDGPQRTPTCPQFLSRWGGLVPRIHAAVLNKTSDTLTPWLMVGQKEPPTGGPRGSGTPGIYTLNTLHKIMRKFVWSRLQLWVMGGRCPAHAVLKLTLLWPLWRCSPAEWAWKTICVLFAKGPKHVSEHPIQYVGGISGFCFVFLPRFQPIFCVDFTSPRHLKHVTNKRTKQKHLLSVTDTGHLKVCGGQAPRRVRNKSVHFLPTRQKQNKNTATHKPTERQVNFIIRRRVALIPHAGATPRTRTQRI